MWWVIVVFTFRHGRHCQFCRVIHRIPRFRDKIFWMRIEEACPEKKVLAVLLICFHARVGTFSNPCIVMVFLRNRPLSKLTASIPCRWCKIVAPIGATIFFHPDSIVLSDVCLISVVARQFNMFKSVKRLIKFAPKVQILENRIGFERWEFVSTVQRLKMCFSHEGGTVVCVSKIFTNGMFIFREFCPKGPGTVLARILTGDNRCARRRAGRIRAVGSIKERALLRQCIQVRGLNFRVETP